MQTNWQDFPAFDAGFAAIIGQHPSAAICFGEMQKIHANAKFNPISLVRRSSTPNSSGKSTSKARDESDFCPSEIFPTIINGVARKFVNVGKRFALPESANFGSWA